MLRSSGVAKGLLLLGALVGGLAGVALALGLRLDQLPPWMITVGMYKLAFIAALGLLVAGAAIGRAARRESSTDDALGHGPGAHPTSIGPGPWNADQTKPNQPDELDRKRRRD
jgi:hypothetical protein